MVRREFRSSFGGKVRLVLGMLYDVGTAETLRNMADYLRYHFDRKWRFVYLKYDLTAPPPSLRPNPEITVRLAGLANLPRVHTELFPDMQGEQIYDKRYFDSLGDDGIACFIAERDGRFVHYSWVFFDLGASPLAGVPLDRRCMREGDVFVGPVFTIPTARGFVYPHVLTSIVHYLQDVPTARRIVLFVYEENPGAVAFYKRMGFTEIEGAQTRSVWRDMLIKAFLFRKARKR